MIDLDQLGVVAAPRTPAEIVMAAALRGRVVRLTRRQRQICRLMRRGLAYKQMGAELWLTEDTIKLYAHKIHRRGLTNADMVLVGLALEMARPERDD